MSNKKDDIIADAVVSMVYAIDIADTERMIVEAEDSGWHFTRHEDRHALKQMSQAIKQLTKSLFNGDLAKVMHQVGVAEQEGDVGDASDTRRELWRKMIEALGHDAPDYAARILDAKLDEAYMEIQDERRYRFSLNK